MKKDEAVNVGESAEALRVILFSALGTCVFRGFEMQAVAWVPKQSANLFAWSDLGPFFFQIAMGLGWMFFRPGRGYIGVFLGLLLSLVFMPNY